MTEPQRPKLLEKIGPQLKGISQSKRSWRHISRRLTDSTGYFLGSELRSKLDKNEIILRRQANILEIGTFEAVGAVYLAWKFSRSMVWTVDPFDITDPGTTLNNSTQGISVANIEKSGFGNRIHQFHITSDNFFERAEGVLFDMIYVDGSHDPEVLSRDLVNAVSILAPGGLLWVDDYGSDYFVSGMSLRQVIDSFWKRHQDCLELVHLGYQAGFRSLEP